MKIADFLASLVGRHDALAQIEGALWAEKHDPRLTDEQRGELVRAKLAIEKQRRGGRAA